MFVPQPFLIALQFLTVIPVRISNAPDQASMSQSILYYPLVGLLIGLLVGGLAWLASALPNGLHAALVLTLWVALTGALHLDGLADSADAWIGGLGDREKTLAIMKDPCCGTMAVISLVIILLLKFTALQHIILIGNWGLVVMVPVIARTAIIVLVLSTPYVRKNGLGRQIMHQTPRRACTLVVITSLPAAFLVLGGVGFWLVGAAAITFYVVRSLMLRRIGGTTGDTAGALLEITETVMLLTACLPIAS